jgi:hypothetical protein
MPAAAAAWRIVQRAVPRASASGPKTAVHARRSIMSPLGDVTAAISCTVMKVMGFNGS